MSHWINDPDYMNGLSGRQNSGAADPWSHEQGRLARVKEEQDRYNATWGSSSSSSSSGSGLSGSTSSGK